MANQKVKQAKKNYENVKSHSKPGSGARFESITKLLSAQGARDPGAVAAAIGRKKYGKEKFQKMAAKGKKNG